MKKFTAETARLLERRAKIRSLSFEEECSLALQDVLTRIRLDIGQPSALCQYNINTKTLEVVRKALDDRGFGVRVMYQLAGNTVVAIEWT